MANFVSIFKEINTFSPFDRGLSVSNVLNHIMCSTGNTKKIRRLYLKEMVLHQIIIFLTDKWKTIGPKFEVYYHYNHVFSPPDKHLLLERKNIFH